MQAQPVDTGLASCAAAEWGPSGLFAALLGHPLLGYAACATPGDFRLRSMEIVEHSTHLEAPAALLRVIRASGDIVASVQLSFEEPRTLAWAPNGGMIVAAAKEGLEMITLRQHEMFGSARGDGVVAGSLVAYSPDTQVYFWRKRDGCRCIRRFRGPRLIVCESKRCAIVPQAISALPPDSSWYSEGYGVAQQQHHGPHLLLEKESVNDALTKDPQQTHRQITTGFPVELCDPAGTTLDIVMSPLGPRHALLLPQCLVLSDGMHCLWFYRLISEDRIAASKQSSIVDLHSLNIPVDCKGRPFEVTGLGGCGASVAVASSGGQILLLQLSQTEPSVQLQAHGIFLHDLSCLRLSIKVSALAGRDPQGRLHVLRATLPSGTTGKSVRCVAIKRVSSVLA